MNYCASPKHTKKTWHVCRKIHTFVPDRGETTVLKREAGGKPELCPQRYIL